MVEHKLLKHVGNSHTFLASSKGAEYKSHYGSRHTTFSSQKHIMQGE